MTPSEVIDDIRSRINPIYAPYPGTESYERRLCAETLEELLSKVRRLEAEKVGNERWMSQAHCMCSDLGVAPGHIEDRLFEAIGRVYALLDDQKLLAECAPHVFSAASGEHLLDGFRPQRRPLDDLAGRVRAALELK